MGTLKFIIKTVMVVVAIGGIPSVADASKASNKARIAHAKELLGGRNYRHSAARKAESVGDISDFIDRMTAEWLPTKHSKKARTLSSAIIHEADKYGFDPVFILAVIQNESGFNPEMRGGHTEIGLMQIKPVTAAWIAKKMKLKYKGEKSLLNPVENVRIGIAFMSVLRDQFESHSRLYISAYNMGARRVRQIVADDRMPKDYVQAVMKRYVAIYSAFADEEKQDLDTLTKNALSRVREVTRAVASS
ncbi:MAG: lytic transglycosylase domain-containing protein [Cryobacterium sp.]|nr:lytic transglycosylase domain-containing protein [Oligoflexia bacterium]